MLTNAPKSIAMNDLGRQTRLLENQLSDCVKRVLASGWYILGAECAGFENEFAAYCGTRALHHRGERHGRAGTGPPRLGIGPGDRVATVANAGGYSTTAIRAARAEPLYIDIDPVSHEHVGRATSRSASPRDTRAVIATHLYGRMADLPALLAISHRAGRAAGGGLRAGARRLFWTAGKRAVGERWAASAFYPH
jgi:dTDP-4-amino-4,6-dideoxygalactose transaminase